MEDILECQTFLHEIISVLPKWDSNDKEDVIYKLYSGLSRSELFFHNLNRIIKAFEIEYALTCRDVMSIMKECRPVDIKFPHLTREMLNSKIGSVEIKTKNMTDLNAQIKLNLNEEAIFKIYDEINNIMKSQAIRISQDLVEDARRRKKHLEIQLNSENSPEEVEKMQKELVKMKVELQKAESDLESVKAKTSLDVGDNNKNELENEKKKLNDKEEEIAKKEEKIMETKLDISQKELQQKLKLHEKELLNKEKSNKEDEIKFLEAYKNSQSQTIRKIIDNFQDEKDEVLAKYKKKKEATVKKTPVRSMWLLIKKKS